MEYEVLDTEDVPITDLSEVEGIPPDLDIRAVDEMMGLDKMMVKLWYFEPGDEIQYHAHSEQEELYYVIKGEFSLKLGKSGETEIVEVGPGAFWAAGPETGHGHRYTGDDEGVVLAVGAPAVADPGLNPHELD
ncbi:MAG: cupin domain-containing protein [Halobacteria archaeon]|nr:cupin domain-containing protein [Halobacteria archaeon]